MAQVSQRKYDELIQTVAGAVMDVDHYQRELPAAQERLADAQAVLASVSPPSAA